MTIWPEYIAPLYNKYTPIEEGPVYDAIKKLADSVEFPLTELFVVDGSQHSAYSNAYFYVYNWLIECLIRNWEVRSEE